MKQVTRYVILLGFLSATAFAESRATKLWKWSAAALVAGNALDAASTVGQYECNPALGRGQFGARSMAIKAGVTTGILLIQRRTHHAAPIVVANFAVGGALTGIAVRNWRSPYRR
jgi:hypothetical protein